MAGSSMIPGIVDHIVKEEIIPLLPWHTRPLLMALSRGWSNALDAIAVQRGNRLDRLDPTNGERIARATRLMQPLKCRVAVEYCHRNRHRQSSPTEPGYVVKVFDGQWRNVPPIGGRGTLFGLVDGTLYFGERPHCRNFNIRIISLDIGSGLWEWQKICRRQNHPHDLLFICRSSRVAGVLYVYRKFRTWLPNDTYFDITEIPEREQIIESAPERHLRHIRCSPLPIIVEVAKKLYFFGSVSYTQSVPFYDLNNCTWKDSKVETHSGDSLNVEEKVLLVGYNYRHFHILRYDSSNERWIIAASMLSPAGILLCWTWCVEYNEEGEKQLWIYIRSYTQDESFNLCKWQVVERSQEGRLMGKVWDDVVLPGGGLVECELINRTPLEEPFHPRGPLTICGSSIYGFHRSDSMNFQDVPRANLPNDSLCLE